MDPGDCTPGEVSDDANAWIIQTFCPAGGVRSVRLDLGEREDIGDGVAGHPDDAARRPRRRPAHRAGPPPISSAATTATTRSPAAAEATSLLGGLGTDELSGEGGDDDLRVRDGIQDVVRCGDGSDRVDADTLDDVDRRLRGGGARGDRGAARCERRARSSWRRAWRSARRPAGGSGTRAAYACSSSSTERGHVAASGALRIDGLARPVNVPRRRIAVGGGGVELSVTLSAAHWRRALRVAAPQPAGLGPPDRRRDRRGRQLAPGQAGHDSPGALIAPHRFCGDMWQSGGILAAGTRHRRGKVTGDSPHLTANHFGGCAVRSRVVRTMSVLLLAAPLALVLSPAAQAARAPDERRRSRQRSSTAASPTTCRRRTRTWSSSARSSSPRRSATSSRGSSPTSRCSRTRPT